MSISPRAYCRQCRIPGCSTLEDKIIANPQPVDIGDADTFREAQRIGEDMIRSGEFNPV